MQERLVVLVTTERAVHDGTRTLATRLAAQARAVLVFLHVRPANAAQRAWLLPAEADPGGDRAWLAQWAPSDAGVPFRHRVEIGDPVACVARFVATQQVELVVVAAPARPWIASVMSRSLPERLARALPCPVVVAPEDIAVAPPPAPVSEEVDRVPVASWLNAVVDARVGALCAWLDHAADAVARIAASDAVQAVAGGSRSRGDHVRLRLTLDEHRRALGAVGWSLRTPDGDTSSGRVVPAVGAAWEALRGRVAAWGASASPPMHGSGPDVPLVQLAAARVGEEGLLILWFDARDHFLRILGQPGPVASFETYAFDADGWMLSNTRFPDDLRRVGLLSGDGAQTPLRIRVAEPSDGPVGAWPLTRMARRATRHQDGWDTQGYRDYRGTPVVGAWRWVRGYDFGVTAEVDRER